MATASICPVVGTTNTTLPPTHPEIDTDKPGQVCPVTNASTDHHSHLLLNPHPSLESTPSNPTNASACPALKSTLQTPENKAIDEGICPVVGPVSTVLPPDHPPVKEGDEGKECPVTKAKVEHHKQKVATHPKIDNAQGVCPVVGARA